MKYNVTFVCNVDCDKVIAANSKCLRSIVVIDEKHDNNSVFEQRVTVSTIFDFSSASRKDDIRSLTASTVSRAKIFLTKRLAKVLDSTTAVVQSYKRTGSGLLSFISKQMFIVK